MSVFAVNGYKKLRFYEREHKFQLLFAGVTRNVQLFERSVKHLCALPVKIVDNVVYRPFVSGDRRRRKYYRIFIRDVYLIVARRHPRERAHRLALRTRAYNAYLLGRVFRYLVSLYYIFGIIIEFAYLFRHFGYVYHATSRKYYFTLIPRRHVDYLLKSVHIRCKRRNYYTSVSVTLEYLLERRSDGSLGHRISFSFDVGGLAEHQENSFVSYPCKRCKIDGVAVDRSIVYLKVARMEYYSDGSLYRKCQRARYRMAHLNEFDVKTTDLLPVSAFHNDGLRLRKMSFLYLVFHEL